MESHTNGTPFSNGYPPQQTIVSLQPVDPTRAPESQQSPIRLKAMLAALRRRWFVATTLGILLSTSAAAAVWYSIPDTYEAFAELIIDPGDTFIHGSRETREYNEPLNVYKQTKIRLATYSYVLTAALRDENVANCPTIRAQKHPEDWLAENLKVSSPATQFIRISLNGQRPADLAMIVNAVVDAFKREVIDVSRQERRLKLEELQDELRKQEVELDRKIQLLRQQREEIEVADQKQAELRYETLSGFSLEFMKQLGRIEWEILQTEVELERLRAQPSSQAKQSLAIADGDEDGNANADRSPEDSQNQLMESPIGVADSLLADMKISDDLIEAKLLELPEYVQLREALHDAERRLTVCEKRFVPPNSRITEAKAEVALQQQELENFREEYSPEIRQNLIAQMHDFLTPLTPRSGTDAKSSLPADGPPDPIVMAENSLSLLKSKRDAIKERLDAGEVKQDDFAIRLIDLNLREEEVAEQKAHVKEIRRIEHARNVELEYQEKHATITVSREASVPKSPERGPRIKMASVVGLGVLGLVVASIVLLEYSAHRLNSVSEVQSDLNLQVMSTIPLIPRWLNSRDDPASNQKSAYWHSVLTESVDAMRTLLLRHSRLHGTKTVMVASATGGEGKTTLSCHLATSLARSGRQVLLIDGDIRRPSVHKVYDLDNSFGFCEVMLDEIELADAIHHLSPDGLSVLTAGNVDSSVLKVLSQDRLGQLIDVARQKYDYIILDTSPILPVTDALLMSQFVDGVLLSLRKDVSRAAKVGAAVQRLTMLGVNIVGAVAIGLEDGPSPHTYPGYNYGYGYGVNPHVPSRVSQPRG